MSYNPLSQRSISYAAITGFNTTIPNGITLFVVTSGGALATGTIILSANPSDGQPLTIQNQSGISVLTLSPNTGQTIAGIAPTLATASTPIRLKYAAFNSTWYPN